MIIGEMMSLKSMEGGVLIPKQVLISLLEHLRPQPITARSTLFEVGQEEQKKKTAEILQRHLKIDIGLSPVPDMIRELRR